MSNLTMVLLSIILTVAHNTGCCQNSGPLLGPLNARCSIILRTQKRAIILTTTHLHLYLHLYLYPLKLDSQRDHNETIIVARLRGASGMRPALDPVASGSSLVNLLTASFIWARPLACRVLPDLPKARTSGRHRYRFRCSGRYEYRYRYR